VPETADAAVENVVAALRGMRHGAQRPVTVTWVNHYSVRGALTAPEALRAMDLCGVDGQLLKRILDHPSRTSADLVVPVLLRRDAGIATVLAIGGRGDRGADLTDALSTVAGRPVRVVSVDGFDGLQRGEELAALVRELRPDLVLVGLGAGLQERVLVEAAGGLAEGYALTCGGFLDQVLQTGYYPAWAYPLRLNWLVRLAREPRRLWRRYTLDALRAVADRRELRDELARVPGIARHAEACAAGESAPLAA
jgi:UDP-N-acetyl-D-mannosaminuronic acid transferase (WecB/TagA/CpsF family)